MEYTAEQIRNTVSAQRKFFRSGATFDVDWRIKQLKRLKVQMQLHEKDITDALAADLGRSEAEAYFCDIGTVILEINEMIQGVRRWTRPQLRYSGVTCFPSVLTKVYAKPYGVSLIISPFNFPFTLTFGVLAASIAGGNTAVIKTSSKTPHCTEVMMKLVQEIYPEEYVTVIGGGHDVADMCLDQRFDKIFYTGSPAVAKHVMAKASEHLTPVALELGGETGNWCVIRKDADLKDAARKIAFFKLCNSGQICININQVAVAEEVAEAFLDELEAAFIKQIGESALTNPEYPHLISKSAWQKCAEEADEYRDRIVFGGKGDPETLRYEPTVIYPVSADESIVQHELFSPLLPVVPFPDEKVDEILDVIAEREHGLAFYLFTRDIRWANRVMETQQFGGGCINEVCLHMMVKGAPFNGTGHSGMGAYHGVWGFREFTYPCTVLRGSTKFNLPLREHPYTGKKNAYKMALLRLFEQ